MRPSEEAIDCPETDGSYEIPNYFIEEWFESDPSLATSNISWKSLFSLRSLALKKWRQDPKVITFQFFR